MTFGDHEIQFTHDKDNLPVILPICISLSSSGIYGIALGLVAVQRCNSLWNQAHFDCVVDKAVVLRTAILNDAH